jgi:hypothetical protein
MPIPPFLLDRIRTAALNGEHLADAFAKLALVADYTGGNANMNLEYVAPGDTLMPGDLVPVLVLALVRQPDLPDASSPGIIDAEFTIKSDKEPYPHE